MTGAVVNYDIDQRHSEVKLSMEKLGYSDCWTITKNNQKVTYYLPNTTLWKKDTTVQQALRDLQGVIRSLNQTNVLYPIQLLRCITLEDQPWDGIPGQPL